MRATSAAAPGVVEHVRSERFAPAGRSAVAPRHEAGARWTYEAAKRCLDLVLSLTALIVSLPLVIAIAVLVRLDSPGPAIFRQRRVARGGGTFTFYKFRTMYVDSRERFPELYAFDWSVADLSSVCLQLQDDPRLTRLGRFLRRTSLDELPNFVNVVAGQMSVVGPRPELPEVLRYYRPEQLEKFSVRPGVTGLAQINGRGFLSFQETIAADLEYCRRRSFAYDLWIMLRTVVTIVRTDGAF